MPVQTTYPGVYIVEQPSGSHVITGVATSLTAFVGAARKGPGDTPTQLSSFADYVRTFGDVMDTTHPMGHAVGQFFTNGGSQAIIVRALGVGATSAVLALPAVQGLTLTLTARSLGAWANGSGGGTNVQTGVFAAVTAAVDNPSDRFALELIEWAPGVGGGPATKLTRENWAELSMSPGNTHYVVNVLNACPAAAAPDRAPPASQPPDRPASPDCMPGTAAPTPFRPWLRT